MSSEEREFVLRSIRDLDAEHDAGDIADDDYRALRDQYVARAAALLKVEPEPEVVVAERPSRRRARRVAAAVALAALVATGSGLAVARGSGERLPDEEASGSIDQSSSTLISRAERLVSEGKVLDAVKTYDQVLRQDPQHPVALAQRGWLISRAGLVDEGLESIDQAIAADPHYAEARFFRAMILWQDKHDPAAAAAEFQAVLDSKPPPELVKYVQDARARALADAHTAQQPQQPEQPPG